MNAVEFLNEQMNHRNNPKRIYETGHTGENASLELHTTRKDGSFLYGAIDLTINHDGTCEISTYSYISNDAIKTLDYANLITLAASIAVKWEAAVEDEKVHKHAISEAKRVYEEFRLRQKIYAVKEYCSLTGLGLKESLEAVHTMIDADFPIHTCQAPPITNAQVEQAFDDIVEIFDEGKPITESVLKQLAIVKNSGHVADMYKHDVRQYAWKFNLIYLLNWLRDNDSNEDYSKLAQALYEYEQTETTS